MMKPIRFSSHIFLPLSPEQISLEIANMDNWSDFSGYGILPSIDHAKYEKRLPDMVGSRIAVTNTDGSTHIEEIYKWNPTKELGLRLMEFSAPLNRIAGHFIEEWDFSPQPGGTNVVRSFELYPKHRITRLPLWLISLFFRRAIDKHLAFMADTAPSVSD